MSCQLSFYPLADENYEETVKQVLDIISKYQVKYQVNAMSTIITGEAEQVFLLIQKIYASMAGKTNFVMNMSISNTCGL
jgi:uncharacterized protein YqgV (UPF0045/DUF77 family)